MTLNDLMRGQSSVLLQFIKDEIGQTKFVADSRDLARESVGLKSTEYGGVGYLDEIVTDVRLYNYDRRTDGLLDEPEMSEVDKERHHKLAKWYGEFFIKYCVLTRTEGIKPDLWNMIKFMDYGSIMDDGYILKLSEIAILFNEFIRLSNVKNFPMYMVDAPDRDTLIYSQEALQRYENKILAHVS